MFLFVKVPPKSDFQSITEEPKYQAKALTVVTDTIKTAGAAVVLTIPSDRKMSDVRRRGTRERAKRGKHYDKHMEQIREKKLPDDLTFILVYSGLLNIRVKILSLLE